MFSPWQMEHYCLISNARFIIIVLATIIIISFEVDLELDKILFLYHWNPTEAQAIYFCFECFNPNTCAEKFLGSFPSPEACCFPTDGYPGHAGGGSYVALGSESCMKCRNLMGESKWLCGVKSASNLVTPPEYSSSPRSQAKCTTDELWQTTPPTAS